MSARESMATLNSRSQGQPLTTIKLSKTPIKHASMHHNTHTTKQEALITSLSKFQLIHCNEYPHGNVGDSDVKLLRTTIQYNSTHTNTIPELIIDALNFPRLGIKLDPLSNSFYPGPLLVAAPSLLGLRAQAHKQPQISTSARQ